MKAPILITGCARSGTSMVAGIINLCGAFSGDCVGPNNNNAKGMFENAHIRNNILKPYLREEGLDPLGQYPLPNVNEISIPNDLRKRVQDTMKNQGYKEGEWMYKGAKMCLTWPIWQHAFPDAKWVIVRRRTGDIVNSCMKTGFMAAFNNTMKQKAVGAKSPEEGWVWWVRQHEDRFVEMIQKGMNVKVVWPDRMVNGDYSQMAELIDWLGLEWNSEIYNFIDPKLWKARQQL